ncbi:MAG TPA: sulfotransferase domain-containing protein [Terriglobia bacterium]|nr:sulfotransferase domain-containing protein [Terriglobia bacterium]
MAVAGESYQEGLRLFRAGRVQESIALFAQALKEHETSACWNDWASAAQLCGHSVEAERGFRRALDLDPWNLQAAANLGVLLAMSSRTIEAISFLTRSLCGIDDGQRPAVEKLLRQCRGSTPVEASGKAIQAPTGAGVTAPETDSPILAYYGHHKCGSTWILKVMLDVCQAVNLVAYENHYEHCFGGDIVNYRRQHHFDFWAYTNADYAFIRPINTIGFHVVRDPRDVVVSGYFSHLKTHSDEGWPRLRFYRPYLQSLSKEEGLMREMEFSGVFLQHMLSWDYDAKPSILELKFEDMILKPFDLFKKVLEHLSIMEGKIACGVLTSILEKYSFKNLSGGRSPGQEDMSNHYRRGVHGDWRNHFTKKHIAYFKSLYNPLLLKLGYEHREDWS